MSRFKGYKNRHSKKNRIFSMEDLLKMSMGEFFDRENELDYQDSLIGLPTNDELKNSPNVRFVDSYTDENGQNYPARWESLLPTPAETMTNMENLKNPMASKPIDNDFTELDNFTQEQIAKLKNNQETPQLNQDDIEDVDLDLDNNIQNIIDNQSSQEIPMPKFDANTNEQNPLSKLLSGLTQGLSALNTDKTNIPNMLTESILGENDEHRFYQIDPNQQKVVNYMNNDLTMNEEEKLRKHQEELKQQNRFPDGVIQAPVEDYNPQIYGHVETSDIEDNLFRKPAEPIKDVINEILNNKIDYDNNKTNWEKFQEKIYTKALKKKFPVASEATENGINDMSAAKKNPNATIYDSINDLEDKSLTEKFKKLKTDENIKGVVYDSNSKEAQKITNSKELNDYVDKIINNGGIPHTNTLEFKQKENIFSPDNDLHYSLQNVTVHEPKISEDGKTFTCKIVDVSDFNERPKTIQNIPNNWGYKMQEKGHYQNYFEVIEIEIPLTDEQKELLKKRKRF